MKPGVRPVVLSGCVMSPEHPTYWYPAEADAAAIALLVRDGQCEYAPIINARHPETGAIARAPEPALEVVTVDRTTPRGGGGKFARRTPSSE
jgi:hypothetical protein